MVAVSIIVSLILAFLWNVLVLWVGAKIVWAPEGSWRNCAKITGVGFAVLFAIAVLCLIGVSLDSSYFGLFCLATILGSIWLMMYYTMNVLDIGFWKCVLFCIVTVGLDAFASYLLSKVEGVLPVMKTITDWLSF